LYAVTSGDFNNDGLTDLVTADYGADTVSILLGNGSGSFGPAASFAVGNFPSSLAVGDFDGDGRQDVATANFGSNDVSVLLGDGTGNFGPVSNYASGPGAASLSAVDFNTDGSLDLAVVNSASNSISILLGNGSGGFGAASNFAVGQNPFFLTVADFNGDGLPDVATSNSGSDDVSILLGNGTGSLGAATNFGVAVVPQAIAVGDFNGDSRADLAVPSLSDVVSVLLGNGLGGFSGPTNFAVGTDPRWPAVGDFNADGLLDLVVANLNSNDVSVLLGNGSGGFGAATNFGAGVNPMSVAVADFNRDGSPDLAVANNLSNNVSILLNTCGDMPPTVVSTSLLTSYAVTGPGAFAVTFSEAVNDPAGNTNPNDVTNPNNYLLVNAGANSVVNTTSCVGGVLADDTRVTVTSVSYNPATFTATVTLASTIPAGKYRLLVCGTTSIMDLAGNILAGNGITPGTDYILDFTVNAATTPASSSTAPAIPSTGFAPRVISYLPAQPAAQAYRNLTSIWLEIPSQKIKSNIVGIPKTNSRWDVTWLGNNIGWLNGTAFPSWEGNSVLTAHVYNANGRAGPFWKLKDLKYGDRIIVHLDEEQYIFEVRSTRQARPAAAGFAFQHLEDHSFLTLITCEGYDKRTNSYAYRRVVRAVLVEVK
jgi:LPXTG-site transpeptidase (sortase) family protein